jgi:hypothetical protein
MKYINYAGCSFLIFLIVVVGSTAIDVNYNLTMADGVKVMLLALAAIVMFAYEYKDEEKEIK